MISGGRGVLSLRNGGPAPIGGDEFDRNLPGIQAGIEIESTRGKRIVQLASAVEVTAAAPDIAHRDGGVGGDLLLNTQAVRLNARDQIRRIEGRQVLWPVHA